MSVSNNQNISYINAVIKEEKEDRSEFKGRHFLRAVYEYGDDAEAVKRVLDEAKKPERNTPNLKRKMIIWCVKQFGTEFDPILYESFGHDYHGALTKCVWKKFHDLKKEIWPEKAKEYEERRAKKVAEIKAQKIKATEKKADKINERARILGKGNMEEGLKRFNDIKKIEMEKKHNKVNVVGTSLLLQFNEWCSTKEGVFFMSAMKNRARVSFGHSAYQNVNTGKKRIYVQNNKAILNLLYEISEKIDSHKYLISAVYKWDKAHEYPVCGNVVESIDGGLEELIFHGGKTIMSPYTVNIRGINEINGMYSLTLNETTRSYRMFPKKFEKLEYKNPKRTATMYITRKVIGNNLCMVNIKYGTNTVTVSVRDSDTARESVSLSDLTSLHEDEVITKLKEDTQRQIKIQEEERKRKAEEARRLGMLKSKKSKGEEKTASDYLPKLKDLVEMYQKGMLTDKEFMEMKTNI